ncbi:hypothetical protein BDV41DRAFT_564630 [Aspergillus transmontanensis]|uniref:Uncharacterized protein n=1 Tax=Aspergillus transmontanensis TaxID=1034304 RepID=A0A5N6VWU0_9EURO|nr:hypothetical protein BDV41DRAFT_564630 [Aspergillus transmontanensis]
MTDSFKEVSQIHGIEVVQAGLEPIPNQNNPHHVVVPVLADESVPRESRICGLRKMTFWLAVIVGALVAIVIALAVGLGVGLTRSHSTSTPTIPATSSKGTSTPSSSTSSNTASSSSTSTSTLSPTSTTLFNKSTNYTCPDANNTEIRNVSGGSGNSSYYIFCDADISSSSKKDLSSSVQSSFADCLALCNSMNNFQDRTDVGCTYNFEGTGNQDKGTCWCLSDNYIVQLDLSASFSTDDGSKYKMSLVDSESDKANTTLFTYGGNYLDVTSVDQGLWTYTIADGSWKLQQTSIKPVRLQGGAYVDAPQIQAAYWVGGFQNRDTTPAITDSTVDYATGMIQFNTTTGTFTQLDAPFTPVQQGALVYLPIGEKGVLVFVGGEVPSIQNGINATLTPNQWNYAWVYDIAGNKWYNQTTTGNVASRTQFCAVVEQDLSTSSYQIYVIGGADYESKESLTDVSYLSIPSFKWFQAASLNKPRMTHVCQAYGRQIFGVGGRLAWSDDAGAGCYDMPAFIYDAQSEVIRTQFDPGLSTYSLPSATANDIKSSPYPLTWADPVLKSLFVQKTNDTTNSPDSQPDPSSSTSGSSTKVGPIVGGVVGGIAGAAIILAIIFFILRKRRRDYQKEPQGEKWSDNAPVAMGRVGGELPAEAPLRELDARSNARIKLLLCIYLNTRTLGCALRGFKLKLTLTESTIDF